MLKDKWLFSYLCEFSIYLFLVQMNFQNLISSITSNNDYS